MRVPPIVVYTVLRLLFFLVPLALMLVFLPIFREYWWLATIFAAFIGLSLSMILLRRPLSEATAQFERRRARRRERDEDAEDAASEDPDQPTNAQNSSAP